MFLRVADKKTRLADSRFLAHYHALNTEQISSCLHRFTHRLLICHSVYHYIIHEKH